MAAPLEISAGYNQLDPLRDAILADSLPAEQDPAVVARCPEVLWEVAALCCRYAETEDVPQPPDSCFTDVRTPWVSYETTEGPRGLVALHTVLRKGAGLALDLDFTEARLEYSPPPVSRPIRSVLMVVSEWGIWQRTSAGIRAGRHAQLNYFRMIADKIREAAFPHSPAEAEEQRRHEAARHAPPPVQTQRALESVASL